MPLHRDDLLTIGNLSRRTGLSVSAIRFYEEKGLVEKPARSRTQRDAPPQLYPDRSEAGSGSIGY